MWAGIRPTSSSGPARSCTFTNTPKGPMPTSASAPVTSSPCGQPPPKNGWSSSHASATTSSVSSAHARRAHEDLVAGPTGPDAQRMPVRRRNGRRRPRRCATPKGCVVPGSAAMDGTYDGLADRVALRELVEAYAALADAGDVEAFGALFADQASLSVHEGSVALRAPRGPQAVHPHRRGPGRASRGAQSRIASAPCRRSSTTA